MHDTIKVHNITRDYRGQLVLHAQREWDVGSNQGVCSDRMKIEIPKAMLKRLAAVLHMEREHG